MCLGKQAKKEVKMNVDMCYIVGYLLLDKKSVSIDDIEIVLRRLYMINPNYKIIGTVESTVNEWQDFFKINDNRIVRKIDDSKLYELLFYQMLDIEVINDIEKVIKTI